MNDPGEWETEVVGMSPFWPVTVVVIFVVIVVVIWVLVLTGVIA